MPPQAVQVYGGIVIAEVIYGIYPVIASLAIKEGFDPIAFAFYRSCGSAVLLSALAWYVEGQLPLTALMNFGKAAETSKSFPRRDFLILGALSCLNTVTYLLGIAFTSSTQASLMQPLIPVIACMAGVAFGSEKTNNGKLIGILSSVVGAMYIVYVGQEEADDHGSKAGRRYELGALALVVNVISTALFYVFQKDMLRRHTPIFVASAQMLICTGFMLVLTVLYAKEVHFSSWRAWILTPRREAVLAYAVILTTTVCQVILAWANKITTPSTTTAFSTLQPLIAAAVGAVWLGVVPHGCTLTGGAAILGGLLLTVRSQLSDSSTPRRASEDSSLI